MPEISLILLFFSIALIYSSVGFGGGSSYLAILYLFSFEYSFLRIMALCCNITVVSGGTYIFWKNGYLHWKKIWPFVLVSVPAAYLGGRIKISADAFYLLLGFTLIFAALLTWFSKEFKANSSQNQHPILSTTIGGGIGFLSGLVSIGGGIFLSPFLHILNWDKAKVIAATASFFILVNSLAGLVGQWGNFEVELLNFSLLFSLVFSVFLGGQIGSRWGVAKFSPILIKKITAILVLIVGFRILFDHLDLPKWFF